jgi:RNA polymerase sigma-70 factor (ECF subfamily)
VSDIEPRLLHSWVQTAWSKVLLGRGEGDDARRARAELLVRYHEVVYHYLTARLRDPHAAQELYSNFALRLLESDGLIKWADPQRGRFRHYLRRAIRNLVIDHFRRQGAGPRMQPLALDPQGDDDVESDLDFSPLWRQELLNQAWKALEEHDRRTGQGHYLVLRYQSDHPELKAPQIAERLGEKLGKSMTAEGVRQALHRARERYAALLLEEVERSLEDPTTEELERELISLELLPYCKKALEKRSGE